LQKNCVKIFSCPTCIQIPFSLSRPIKYFQTRTSHVENLKKGHSKILQILSVSMEYCSRLLCLV
jgi:hypothetical protein